mmetsp:Transcript_6035/g.8369  ORF Transcript_6035/g.8369 Transcript_6035/m.8369 type:complete len:209 (-) Transcript_6035:134-760(-)|eukprot:CAMPEP_0184489640 /NCGR_PEP_ID=MMETSP0113_2-20130426/15993_1 /TAXON_ID=91329 /ORGANISM="Norrisiella sphaerica, Strain BC52" /LENGTH=208 /DNA_ID=CAMNT_0026873181 /DNA_START=99 /DNA_END=725 /DNA_ORIENTATION=-
MQFATSVDADLDFHLKVIILGDSGVGKSCLLKSFMGREFSEGYVSTIGVDFEMKQLVVQGRKVNLQIWDTAGQERFRTITTSYYRSCDAILVVFDITEPETFTNVEAWLEDVRSYAKKDVNILLLGNKVDLYADRKVSYENAKQFADSCRMGYIETSAKTDFNVDAAFNKAASLACSRRLSAESEDEKEGGDVHIGRGGKSREPSCCP